MTATDLCKLAAEVFPAVEFAPIESVGVMAAVSNLVTVWTWKRLGKRVFRVTLKGEARSHYGSGDSIIEAHNDAIYHALKAGDWPKFNVA